MINKRNQPKHNEDQMTVLHPNISYDYLIPLSWNESLWRDNQELLDSISDKKIENDKINTETIIDWIDSIIVQCIGAIYCRAFYNEFVFTNDYVPTAWLKKKPITALNDIVPVIIFEIEQKYLDDIDLWIKVENAAYGTLEQLFCGTDLEWMINYFTVEYTEVPEADNGNKS